MEDRLRRYGADHHGRPAGAHWAGHDGHGVEFVILAVPRHLFFAQEGHQHVEALIELLAALFQGHAQAVHLKLPGPAPDAQQKPTLGENVGHHQLARIGAHIVDGEHRHGGHDLHMLSGAGDLHGKLQGCRQHEDVDHVVLSEGDRFKAQLVGQDRLLQHVGIKAVAAIALVGIVG